MTKNPNIKKVRELNQDRLKTVLYGPPGSGKTTAATTWPKLLMLSAESGLMSVADKDFDVWEIGKWEDMEEALAYLRRGEHPYLSVAIDSVTEIQQKLNEYLIRKFPAVQRAYTNMTALSDWGANIQTMQRDLRGFRDLPINVTFICLSMDQNNDGETSTKPALSGSKLPDQLCGWVDTVMYCGGPVAQEDTGEVKYYGQLVSSKGRRAKVRTPKGINVPSVIDLDDCYANLTSIMFPKTVTGGKK